MAAIVATAASALAASAPSIAAASASAAATSTLAATAISIGKSILLNLAISSAMSLLNPQVGEAGRPIDWTLDPDGPIPFAAGRVGAAGAIVHKATFGPDLMYYGLVSVLSGAGPIKSFQTFKADEEFVTFDGNGKAITSQWRDEMWMKTQRGLQPTTSAMTSPSGLKSGASLPGWGASHRLNGKAAFIKVMGENSKRSAYPNGETKPLWVIEGLYGWDPRQDSTYPGGSGPCRLNDPATWVYLTNPILWALKWSLGLWEGPTGKGAPQVDYQVGGIGAKVEGVDVAALISAANVADANGWTVAAYPTTDDDKAQVLDAFLQAGGAIYAQKAGKISCIQRAAPRTSIVTISAADTAGPIEFDTAASRINRINTLRPRFWSEASRWQMTAIEEVTAAAYQTEDGGKRTRGVDFPYVPNATQAAQLAALQLANTREGIAGTIPLKPHLQRITPGDAFTITEAGFVLDGLKCLCLSTEYDPATGIHNVTFVSETDAKYPFALGQSPVPPESPTLTPVDPTLVNPPLPGDWTITVRPPTAGGGQVPGFDLTGLVSNDTATAIIVEWGLTNDPTDTGNWTQAYQGPPNVTTVPINGLQPGQTYYIAVRYQRNQNYSERYVYGPYLAPSLVAEDLSPTAPAYVALNDQIAEVFGGVFDVAADLAQARIELDAADAAFSSAIGSLAEANEVRAAEIISLQTFTNDLETNKASIEQLDAQILRIDGAEAINASQATALIDLDEGKVEVAEYEVLRAEVEAGRNGQGSLLGEIQRLAAVDLDLEENKAEASVVAALGVRTDQAEADILDTQMAIATETGARSAAISQVRAGSLHRDNLCPNGGAELGTEGITAVHIAGGVSTPLSMSVADGPNGRVLVIGPYGPGLYIVEWPEFSVFPNDTYVLTGDAAVFGIGATDQTYFDLQMRGPSGEDLGPAGDGPQNILTGAKNFGAADREAWAVQTLTPASAGRARARFVISTEAGPTLIQLRQVKAERGTLPASPYSRDGVSAALVADVTETRTAVIDLETQNALAAYEVEALATGGLPAFLRLVSSTLGGYAALAAPVVALLNTVPGVDDPLVALEARAGEVFFSRPIYIDMPGTGNHLIVGGGGPAGSEWLLWFGANTSTAATATRSNGALVLGTNGTIYAPSLADDRGISVNPPFRTVNVPDGSGTISMGSFSAVTTGLTGTLTYAWEPVFGGGIFTAGSPTSAATTITANGAQPGMIYRETFSLTVTEVSTGRVYRETFFITLITESGA